MKHDARSLRVLACVRSARALGAGAAMALALALVGGAAAQEPPPGQDVYERVCTSCHQESGEGIEGTYPSLIGSSVVTGEEDALIRRILNGGGGMPAFASTLSDQEVADVASYVRTAWENDAGAVDAETVAEVRDAEGADPGPEAESDQPATDDADADEADADEADADEAETDGAETDEADSDDSAAEDAGDFAWEELGATVYASSCAACHQSEGQGIQGVYPALAGNGFVQADAVEVVRTILNGRAGMPSFGGDLDDERLAAVASYIRNTWGNEAPVVTPPFVEDVRGGATDVEPTDPNYRPGAAN